MDFFAATTPCNPLGRYARNDNTLPSLQALHLQNFALRQRKNTQAMKIFVLQYSFAVMLEFWHDLSKNLRYI